jgi:hypothetical protein
MRSTLTIVTVGAFLLAPPSAYAREGKRPAMCSDPLAASMNRSACGSGSSSGTRTASAGSSAGVGWSCPLKRDEYDQYRRVQNKSSQKSAETFLGTATTNLLLSVFSSVVTGSWWGVIGNLFSSGMQASNMNAQQKFACEKLELEIAFKKKQMTAIADIGKKTSAQVQEVALNLGKQIPVVVKREFNGQKEHLKIEVVREAVPLLMEELRKAGVQFKEPPPDEAPQAPPDVIPELPERNPNRFRPEVPSVQAPAPVPVIPSADEAVPMPKPAIKPPEQTATAKALLKQARREH